MYYKIGFVLFLFIYSFTVHAKEISVRSCPLRAAVKVETLLGKKYGAISSYFSEFQEETPSRNGGAVLKSNFFKKFGVSANVRELSIEVYEGRVAAILVSTVDPYENYSETSGMLDELMRGCGVKLSSSCWKIGKSIEVDATGVFPFFVRIQYPEKILNSELRRGNGEVTHYYDRKLFEPCQRYLIDK